MEETKRTAEWVYEDDFSYITKEGSVFRKESRFHPEIKIGETAPDKAESELPKYREKFEELEHQISLLSEEITAGEAQNWKQKLEEAQAIGDFDLLNRQIDALAPSADEDILSDTWEGNECILYYKKLMMQAREIAKEGDWDHGYSKLDELSHQWSDGPAPETDEEKEMVGDLYSKFTNAESNFRTHQKAHLDEVNKKKQINLDKKRKLLSDIEKIIQAKDWSAVGKIKQLEKKWSHTGSVPQEQASDIHEKYLALISEFKSHKVDRLVEKKQKEEDNLMMKMVVLDKMDKLAGTISAETSNWEELDETFANLTKQWKKIGRVSRDKADATWNRYKAAQNEYYDRKYQFHKEHRSLVDSFTAKKQNIIEKAENLVEQEDMAKAARLVNKLHRKWKKIGNLPQQKEDKLWDRFKAATDAFNEKKANNPETIKQQEEMHYQQKVKLVEKAEQLKETAEWNDGHKQMQSLMDQWKKVGPVPHKKSNEIWKQFKGAMDVFYDRRRENFKATKEQQKQNLEKKMKLLEELHELGRHDDPIQAVSEAQQLQNKFKEIGYVPIKRKNEIWQQYRAACDVVYDRMRAAKSGNKFDRELAKADLDSNQRSQIQDLRKKHKEINKQVKSLKGEVLQLEESKGNFNFSDKDNPLLKGMIEKINKARAQLENKRNKLEAISIEMEDIRNEG